MSGIDRAQIVSAFEACKTDILANLETLTLKSVRKRLEKDLNLRPDALKEDKHFISDLIDKLIASQTGQVAGPSKGEPASEPTPVKKEKKKPSKTLSKEASAAGAAKPRKSSVKPKDEPQKKKGRPAVAAQDDDDDGEQERDAAGAASGTGRRQLSAATLKLRNLCKRATIGIPPSIYAKNKSDSALAEALRGLLSKHGLSSSSSPEAVDAVARKLAKERDLDGIDTSNIVSGSRRRQVTQVIRNYRDMSDGSSSSEGEDDQDDGTSDAESEQGSDVSPAPRAKKARKAPSVSAGEDDQQSADEEEDDRKSADEEQSESEASEGSGAEDDEASDGSGSADENEPSNKPAKRTGGLAKRTSTSPAPQKRRGVLVDSDDD